ncbi:carboxypeptidase-like regulatory domain-containing protein [Rheinheimera sp. KL1]|uniref:carboxypeptidase-like regulatory domain-containing protein n=1 Tax=Rheinheimera sp. KL1 TaxID=1635005 RepID=UPI0006A9A9B5|nr:carboxypeptidase-like regulatory domain-containing protein [Rheinheimera sp. KL1]
MEHENKTTDQNVHHHATWLLTCAFALPGSVVAAQLAGDGAVSVQVLDGKTARPVVGAAISLQSRDGQKVSKTTDDQGRVKIEGLAVGLYEVRVSGRSYQLFVEPTLRVSKDKTTPIAVELLKTDSIERIQVTSSQRVLDQNASAGTSYLTGDNLTSAVQVVAMCCGRWMDCLVYSPVANFPALPCEDVARKTT